MLGSLILYTGLLTLLGWSVAAVLAAWPGRSAFGGLPLVLLLLGFLNLPFMLWQMYGQSLLMGLDLASRFNRATMVGRTVNLVAVYLMVGWLGWGAEGAILATLVAAVVTAAGGARELIVQAGRRLAPSLACISTLAHGAVRLHLNAIGTYLFTQSGVLVVNHFHGAAATGNYQLAAQLIGVMLIIPNAVSQTLYGVVTKRGPDAAWAINRNVLHRAMGITAVSVAAAWVLAPYLIPGGGPRLRRSGRQLQDHAADVVRRHPVLRHGLTMDRARLVLAGIAADLVRRHLRHFDQPSVDAQLGPEGAIYATLLGYGIGAVFNMALYVHCTRGRRRRMSMRVLLVNNASGVHEYRARPQGAGA